MNLNAIAPQELVDGFMLPAKMILEQKRKADQQLAIIRQQRLTERSEQEKLYGQLLQLKIHIEDYILNIKKIATK